MKILVTGGAGFVGSHVVDLFIGAGHSVSIVDNLATGDPAWVSPTARLYPVDLRSVRLAEKPKRPFASRCRLVRS